MFNVKQTRQWLSREGNSIPTASPEAIFLTSIIDEYEGKDIMVMDVPNTLIQTNMPPNKYSEERVIMKTRSVIVDMLL